MKDKKSDGFTRQYRYYKYGFRKHKYIKINLFNKIFLKNSIFT